MVICVCFAVLPAPLRAQHPNDSIVPQKPKPTPYGMQISRSDDRKFRKAEIVDVDDLPSLAPYLDTFELEETEEGPYDVQLSERLHDLGRLRQSSGIIATRSGT